MAINWKAILQFIQKEAPAIELAGNVVLLATGVGAGIEPLVAQIENAVNPAIQAIGTQQTPASIELTIYASIIGVLVTLEKLPNLPAATLTQIQAYITAAQEGIAGATQAAAGFDPANYAPVTPIA